MNDHRPEPHPRSTVRLRLRRLTIDDATLMLAIWNDPAFVKYVGDRGIRTLDDARRAVNEGPLRLFSEHGYGPYVMELKDRAESVGICGLFRREGLDDPDIGFAVLPDRRGRGLVFEAAQSVLDYAREQLTLPRITAIVSPENAASVALIRKLGLEFERMHRMAGDDDEVALYGLELAPARGR